MLFFILGPLEEGRDVCVCGGGGLSVADINQLRQHVNE